MYYEALIAKEIGLLLKKDCDRQNKLLKKFGLMPKINMDIKKILNATMLDKKSKNNIPLYSLIDKIGHCKYNCQVDEKIINNVICKKIYP
jgi:3-dehydroquinate synthetase